MSVSTKHPTDKNKYEPYVYKVVKVVRVYDGDTITVVLDLGFSTYTKKILRIANINAPEIRGEERSAGLAARNRLRSILENAENIFVTTYKDHTGKYGRYIADVYADDINVGQQLVKEGLADEHIY